MGQLKFAYTLVLCFLILSCSSTKYNATYRAFDYNKPQRDLKVKLKLPEGFALEKKIYDHSVEHIYSFPDSSTFFISNNKMSGSRINNPNRLSKGIDVLYKDHERDSLFLNGKNSGGFWKEEILDNIVVGYLNVSKERQAEFDKAISSLKIK